MKVERTEYYCPVCGCKTVHVDRDYSGDYYHGTTHYCLACHRALPDLDQGVHDVLWKHTEFGGDPDRIQRYMEIRMSAGLPPSTDEETVRIERELAEAHRMRTERLAK